VTKRSSIRLRRVYDEPSDDEGTRILVERLWPRGLRKQDVAADLWLKDTAPSPELRKWYAHDVGRWEEFSRRYRAELRQNDAALEPIRAALKQGTVTFLFAARDADHSSAALLKEYIEKGARS
jgi:uncharacterized protein YeaO (DUF488 family)